MGEDNRQRIKKLELNIKAVDVDPAAEEHSRASQVLGLWDFNLEGNASIDFLNDLIAFIQERAGEEYGDYLEIKNDRE